MENVDDCEHRTFSCEFYFYPKIYSDKCHFDLVWYKKIFYFIRFIPRMYFYSFKKICSVIFLGKVVMSREYIGSFFATNEQEIHVGYRIIAFIGCVFCHVMPFLTLCLFVTNLFIHLPSILSIVMWAGVLPSALLFPSALICSVIVFALDKDIGARKTLYACNCTLSKDIHWSMDKCEVRNLDEFDKEYQKKFLYPGQIKEIKLDYIHDENGDYPYRLN